MRTTRALLPLLLAVPACAGAPRYPLLERQRLRADRGGYTRSAQWLRPGGGYLGFSEALGALRPEEREALESTARREGPAPLDIRVPFHAGGELSVRRGPVTLRRRVLDARRAEGAVDGGLVRYEEVLPHTDLLVIADEASADQLYYLKDAGSPWPVRVAMDVSGGGLSEEQDGSLAVRRPDGALVFGLGRPVIVDAAGLERKGRWLVLASGPGSYVVSVLFDPTGLRYPLLID